LDYLPSAILWTWPYHVSWFCSISFTIVSNIQTYNFACCFVWVWNLVSHSEGET
jgi:hypothetical protein